MKLIIDIPEAIYDYCLKFNNRIRKEGIAIDSTDTHLRIIVSDGKPLDDELQEIKQEIDNIHIYGENDPSTYQRFVTGNQVKQMILEIIDTHISALSGKEPE